MDHVSGTERFMEPGSCGCKSLCPLRYKALVQTCVGERRGSLPLDPQLAVGYQCSQVRAPDQGTVGFGERNLVRDRPSAIASFSTIFPVQVGEVHSSVFLFFFPRAQSSTLSPHIPGSPNPFQEERRAP